MSVLTTNPRFDGRTAIITGAARGIGLTLARALAEHGADTALLDRSPAVGDAAHAISSRFGGQSIGITVDVTSPSSVDHAVREVAERLETADILVNCAGITSGTPALALAADEWSAVLGVNVTGTFLMCQSFARTFTDEHGDAADRRASIVNVSSMSAFAVNVPQTQAAYNASKAAVSMLTSSLAIEWLPLRISVNAIAPGYVASDMTKDFAAAHPIVADEWVRRTPIGRMAEPEDLVAATLFLLSPGAEFVVGQSLVIDGGYTIV